jgi:SAM-dependent methyltransferase
MNLEQTLTALARQYPQRMIDGQLADVPRIAFNIQIVLDRKAPGSTLADIGGGIGLYSVGCAAAGLKPILVDDFQDENNRPIAEEVLRLHKSKGVQIISQDVISKPLDLPDNSLDAITCFDSMEHWHNSPKRLFHRLMQILKPGGLFVLAVPNCVNMRKRLTVPFGNGKWSRMEYWYEPDVFRAHVREPDVDDLHYIARDLKLQNVEILGRNWLGYASGKPVIRAATKVVDKILQFRPTLCSNIYLLGTKPSAAASR